MEVFRREGLRLRVPDHERHDHHRERAEALADLARRGFLKHISVSIDGPGEMHDKARA